MDRNDAFKEAVELYLNPYIGHFNYENMLNAHLDISRFREWVRQVSQYRKIVGSIVLSSGCGSAGDLLAFLEAGALKAYGIEIDFGLADLGRKRFLGTQYEKAIELQVYNGSILPYASNAFDIIFSMHVIEHTKDPSLYLTELFRVLRPGGIIFLDVPNRYYWMEQHTLIPFVHWLPTDERDLLIRFLLSWPFAHWFSSEIRYKLSTYLGVRFPSADELIALYQRHRNTFSLDLRDAFYHSYSDENIPFRMAHTCRCWFGSPWRMTTFRLVIGKA